MTKWDEEHAARKSLVISIVFSTLILSCIPKTPLVFQNYIIKVIWEV